MKLIEEYVKWFVKNHAGGSTILAKKAGAALSFRVWKQETASQKTRQSSFLWTLRTLLSFLF